MTRLSKEREADIRDRRYFGAATYSAEICDLLREIDALRAELAEVEKQTYHPFRDPDCKSCHGSGWIMFSNACDCVDEALRRIARDAKAIERERIAAEFERQADEIMASPSEAARGPEAQFRRAMRRRKYAMRVRTMGSKP